MKRLDVFIYIDSTNVLVANLKPLYWALRPCLPLQLVVSRNPRKQIFLNPESTGMEC